MRGEKNFPTLMAKVVAMIFKLDVNQGIYISCEEGDKYTNRIKF